MGCIRHFGLCPMVIGFVLRTAGSSIIRNILPVWTRACSRPPASPAAPRGYRTQPLWNCCTGCPRSLYRSWPILHSNLLYVQEVLTILDQIYTALYWIKWVKTSRAYATLSPRSMVHFYSASCHIKMNKTSSSPSILYNITSKYVQSIRN